MEYLPKIGLEDFSGKALKNTLAACAAELIGTMFLNLVGCGSALNNGGDYVRIALCFGVTVATMAQSIGHISGCHINPAVTAGLLVGRKIGLIKAILYIVSQCIGAVIGTGLLLVFYPSELDVNAVNSKTGKACGIVSRENAGPTKETAEWDDIGEKYIEEPNECPWPGYLGVTGLGTGITAGQGFGIEFFITFVLILVVFGAAADDHAAAASKGSAPLAIGLSITTCHLYAIPLTGSSMNPARSFGSAVIAKNWANHWVYWLGPICGGICASILYNLILRAEDPAEGEPKPATKEEHA